MHVKLVMSESPLEGTWRPGSESPKLMKCTRGGARTLLTRGLFISTRELKHCWQGTIGAKNLCKKIFSPYEGGLACSDGALATPLECTIFSGMKCFQNSSEDPFLKLSNFRRVCLPPSSYGERSLDSIECYHKDKISYLSTSGLCASK